MIQLVHTIKLPSEGLITLWIMALFPWLVVYAVFFIDVPYIIIY
jgi:hypothetical protein